MYVYDIGDRRKLICEVYDENSALTDPTTLTFMIREPCGTITTYIYGTDAELVKDSVGKYHVYWDCVTAGHYDWRYEADGTVVAAEESHFSVRRSIFK